MLTQMELANLVDSYEDDRDDIYIEPSYVYKKNNYKRFNINSSYGKCKAFNITLSFGKCLIIKPITSWRPNSIGKKLDKNCIYLVCNKKWYHVPYKNYIDDDRAFDVSMRNLIRYAKFYLTKTSR